MFGKMSRRNCDKFQYSCYD